MGNRRCCQDLFSVLGTCTLHTTVVSPLPSSVPSPIQPETCRELHSGDVIWSDPDEKKRIAAVRLRMNPAASKLLVCNHWQTSLYCTNTVRDTVHLLTMISVVYCNNNPY